ncbi:MAG: winged helix-turn-helix domain-containing protein [Candidatus Bathyarchaeota archaeon]|nr:winged helix-turn-helix domain-containing protein [Candidatus Bathyarchaeota archaeon]
MDRFDSKFDLFFKNIFWGIALVRKKRDRLSIIISVLDAAGSGACKTRIMLKANLNYTLVNKYLSIVMEFDLIKVEGSNYSLTSKGSAFLKQYWYIHERYVNTQALLETLNFEYQKLSSLYGDSPTP